MYLVVVGFFLAFFWPGSVVKNGIQRDVPSGQTWWLSSVLGNDWDVGWQGRARSPPPYIAILPPGSHWQWCNPSWSSPSWSWPAQVEGRHGQGEAVLVFRYFGGSLSGLLRAPPTVPPHESVEDLPRDRRNFYGDPDRAAPPAGAGPGRCQSRLGASSLSPLVLHVLLPCPSRFPMYYAHAYIP